MTYSMRGHRWHNKNDVGQIFLCIHEHTHTDFLKCTQHGLLLRRKGKLQVGTVYVRLSQLASYLASESIM